MSTPAYRAEIDGVERTVLRDSIDINESNDGVNSLVCLVLSETGTYRPPTDGEFILYRTDLGSPETIRFAGLIVDAEEVGFVGPNDDAITVRITVVDYKDYLDRLHLSETRPAETLKARLQWMVTDYLSAPYSITLDAAQADGPTLAARVYDYTKILDAIRDMATETGGYQPKLSYAKVLGMYAPGVLAAPFDVIEGAGTEQGDIRVKRTRTQGANRIILTYGPTAVMAVIERFVGDGVTDTFDLDYSIAGPVLRTVEVQNSPIEYETVREYGEVGGFWEVSADRSQITRLDGPLDVGEIGLLTHNSQFPKTIVVEASPTPTAPIEKKITRTDIIDVDAARAFAAGELAKAESEPTVVMYETAVPGLAPGMTQHITSSRRDINADFVITEVSERAEMDGDGFLYAVTAVDAHQYTDWRQWQRDILGGGSASSATPPTSTVIYGATQNVHTVSSTPYGSEPASPAAGDLDLYTNAPLVARFNGTLWIPYGPIHKFKEPPTSGWSWVNQGSATIATTNGGQKIVAPSTSSGANLHLRVRAAPSTPYVIDAYIDGHRYVAAWKSWGLCWRESSSGKLVTVTFAANGNPAAYKRSIAAKYTSATAFSADYSGSGGPVPTAGVWVRITDDGANRTYALSHDGQTWTQMHSIGRTDFLTADQVGFLVSSEAAAGTAALDVCAHLLSWEES